MIIIIIILTKMTVRPIQNNIEVISTNWKKKMFKMYKAVIIRNFFTLSTTLFSTIWPIDRTLSGATTPSQCGAMAMKEYSAFPKAPALPEPLWRFRNYQRTPNRMLTRRLPDTKCINASPRIRLHASIRLKSEKRKIIKCKVANEKRSRQN